MLNVINSKCLLLIETLYMTINLCCHYICWLVLRHTFPSDITFLKPLIKVCVNNGHTNYLARSQVCSNHYELRH